MAFYWSPPQVVIRGTAVSIYSDSELEKEHNIAHNSVTERESEVQRSDDDEGVNFILTILHP